MYEYHSKTISPMKTFLLLSISRTMVSYLDIQALLTTLVVRCFLEEPLHVICYKYFKVSGIK
jgi:hypothetical protein